VRNPTSVVRYEYYVVGGEGLARILSPPQGSREEWLLRKGVKRWMNFVVVDVVVVGAIDAVAALMTAGAAGAVNAVAVAATAAAVKKKLRIEIEIVAAKLGCGRVPLVTGPSSRIFSHNLLAISLFALLFTNVS
jgi:hypothetical protein